MKDRRLIWPAAVLVALLVLDVVVNPGFLAVHVQDGHLYGSPVSILIYGSPLALVSLGMMLVIATGGIDLSVGAVVAISGAVACTTVAGQADQGSVAGVLTGVALALVLGGLLGAWNGVLVSLLGIQPIVATLILMVAGRGIAQLVTDGQIITLSSPPYALIGGGYVAGLPFAVLLVAAAVAGTALLLRRTALGLFVEAVGGNAEASRLAGIRARGLTVLVYAFCGLTAAVAGLMVSSNIQAADGNNAGLWIELDAILAVVIGGTSLNGGRFSIAGTVLGAFVIQTLTTTIYGIGVPTQANLVFKAVVVIVVCLLQSPVFRAKVLARRPRTARPGGPAATTAQPPQTPQEVTP